MKTIKQIISELVAKGFTRTEIAEQAGVSISTVSRVLTGQYTDMDYTPGRKIEIIAAKTRRVKK